MNKTVYIQRGHDIVTIYDAMDAAGNGNVRFRGTIEAALTHFAFVMQERDELRDELREQVAALTEERDRLKTQLVGR